MGRGSMILNLGAGLGELSRQLNLWRNTAAGGFTQWGVLMENIVIWDIPRP